MNQAGFVAIALAGLWIAYLVPHRLRFRQQLLESRSDDRFSEQLRVLRVARPSHAVVSRGLPVIAVGGSGGRVHLHLTRTTQAGLARPGGTTMDRPHATRDRISADAARRTAAEHAERAAHLDRRAAAARRRAALTAVLLLTAGVGWAVAGFTGASGLLGAVPTALLASALLLGRRAVVAGSRADAEWAAGASDRVPRGRADGHGLGHGLGHGRGHGHGHGHGRGHSHGRRSAGVVGRAVHPSDATTEVFARIPAVGTRAGSDELRPAADAVRAASAVRVAGAARAVSAADAATSGAATAGSVTVTAATAGAERASVPTAGSLASAGEGSKSSEEPSEGGSTWAPVPVPRPAYTLKPAARRAEPAPLVLDAPISAAAAAGGTVPGRADDAPTTGGLSLDAILARRRASGE